MRQRRVYYCNILKERNTLTIANDDILIPVILAGGTGSRLWPLSRAAHPKPFMLLPDGQSLLEKTYTRACLLPQTTSTITITNTDYYLKTKATLSHTEFHNFHHRFLLEPEGRNTAPAIAMAAFHAIEHHGNDAILLILPADHLIENVTSFIKHTKTALTLAKANHIVTLGIKPTSPEAGYGYIQCGETFSFPNSYSVKQFIEKPNVELANQYIQSENYLWNSGIFCFKAKVILNEFKIHTPQFFDHAKICWQASRNQSDVLKIHSDHFKNLENISIDYALLEKSKRIATIACDFDWQDIGSFEAYQNLHECDSDGNRISGNAIVIDSKNNFIHSKNRVVASIGVSDLAVIDTEDALLITKKNRSQEVKQVVEILKERADKSYLTHRTVVKPWGFYTVLEEGRFFIIKRIVVKPKASLSLQKHEHRSEHWVVVEGVANVINGDKEYLLKTNESTFVPKQTVHQLSNKEDYDLVIIEVQTGEYLDESDIIRLDDPYGRY